MWKVKVHTGVKENVLDKNLSVHRALVEIVLIMIFGFFVIGSYFIITDWEYIVAQPGLQWIFLLIFWGGMLEVFAIVLELGRPKDHEKKS